MTSEIEELTLEHAKAAYANAQETIRFMDTKAGALTGLSTIVTGLPILVLQWITEQQSVDGSRWQISSLVECHPIILPVLSVVLGAGAFSGVVSLWFALDCISARLPSKRRRPTVLFPMVGDLGSRSAIVRKLRNGLTHASILDEYKTQILRVGFILSQKALALSRAMRWFKLQMAFYGLGAFCFMQVYLTQM